MKYKIGQILYPVWVSDEDKEDEWHKCEIVGIAILEDFSWKYIVNDKDSEYSNMYEIIDEKEIDEEYTTIISMEVK